MHQAASTNIETQNKFSFSCTLSILTSKGISNQVNKVWGELNTFSTWPTIKNAFNSDNPLGIYFDIEDKLCICYIIVWAESGDILIVL